MIIVYPDSNPLWGDPGMEANHSKRLRKALAANGGRVVISPVVLGELRRQSEEASVVALDQAKTAIDKASKSSGIEPVQVHAAIDAHARSLMVSLRAKFDALLAAPEIEMGSMPQISAEELVQRELDRRRPTLTIENQSVGLRDTVIWHGLKKLLIDHPDDWIVFVTKDAGFLDGRDLHPQLFEELDDEEIERGNLHVVPSIYDASVEVARYDQDITDREAAIKLELSRFSSTLDSSDFGWYYDMHHGGMIKSVFTLDLPMSIEQTQIINVEYLGSEKIGEIDPAECKHELLITFEGDMRSEDWYENTETDIELYLGSPTEPYVSVTVDRHVIVETTVDYDPQTQVAEVDEYDVYLA